MFPLTYNANYLKFFERARTEWLRTLGFGQQALADDSGAIFVVSEAHLHYRAPARLDDELRVTVHPARVGQASFVVVQQAWRDTTLLCAATVHIACVNRGTFRPRRIPTDILERLSP
jgi:acyl-CoA thioester hydrolase